MYIYIYMCMFIYTYIFIYIFIYTHIYIHIFMYMYTCTSIYTYTFVKITRCHISFSVTSLVFCFPCRLPPRSGHTIFTHACSSCVSPLTTLMCTGMLPRLCFVAFLDPSSLTLCILLSLSLSPSLSLNIDLSFSLHISDSLQIVCVVLCV